MRRLMVFLALQTGLLFLVLSVLGCRSGEVVDGVQAQPVTLTLSTWGSSQEVSVLKDQLARFERDNPRIRVKLLHIPDNYYQKLHILIAGGLTPDVMFQNSINFPVYAAHDVFLDLAPYVNRQDFYDRALDAFTWHTASNQNLLGALPRDISNLVIYYNRDWFKQTGLPDPQPEWTWLEFLKTAQALTVDADHNGSPERFGVSFYAKPPLFWLPWVWSAGGDLFDPTMRRVVLNSSKALQGLRFYQDLRGKYHVAPRQIESGGVTMSQLFLQQKIAMLVSGRWSVPVFREQADFDWDVAPLPVGPSGQSQVGIDASGYAVSAKTPHPKEAVALAQFLVSKPSIEAVTASGLIVPARPDVAESDVFLSSGVRPKHSQYFLRVIPAGVPTRTPPRWNELSEMLMLALQPVWDGQSDPEQTLSSVIPKLNALLEAGS